MKDLSLHILDIVQNSIKAGACEIGIEIDESDGFISFTIRDNGSGMDAELLESVTDPYTTTRTTRKVGLGIPLLKHACEQTGGYLELWSQPGKGTVLKAVFTDGHIDTPPLGELVETLVTLIHAAPAIDYKYVHKKDDGVSEFDSSVVRAALDGVLMNEPEVLDWIRNSMLESEENLL